MTQIDSTRPLDDPQPDPEPRKNLEPPTPAPNSGSAALRTLAMRVHFYAGLFIGPFLLVAAVSGFFYALSPSIEKVVYHDMTSASSPEQLVSLEEQVDTAQQQFPDLEVSSVIPGTGGDNSRVLFADPTLPSESYTRVAFIDPASGSVDGQSVQYGSGQALPIRTWLSETHRHLHLGEPGRIYSELAASWLAPITLFGLYIWWDQRRRKNKSMLRRDKAERGGESGSRATLRSKHAILGTWVAIGFLGLSATGLTWSTYAGANISDLRTEMNWTTPTLASSEGGGEHAGHGSAGSDVSHADHSSGHMHSASIDDVHAAAVQADLSEPIQMTAPANPGEAWTVAETRRSYAYGPDTVAVDSHSGQVVERLDFADYSLAAKLADWGIRAHMGFLFGIANQVLLAGVAGALVLIVLRGYAMWWKRRPTRISTLPTMPPPGAILRLARAKPVMTAVAAFIVAGVCLAVPLLGISLVAFLIVDVGVQAVRRTRRARAS